MCIRAEPRQSGKLWRSLPAIALFPMVELQLHAPQSSQDWGPRDAGLLLLLGLGRTPATHSVLGGQAADWGSGCTAPGGLSNPTEASSGPLTNLAAAFGPVQPPLLWGHRLSLPWTWSRRTGCTIFSEPQSRARYRGGSSASEVEWVLKNVQTKKFVTCCWAPLVFKVSLSKCRNNWLLLFCPVFIILFTILLPSSRHTFIFTRALTFHFTQEMSVHLRSPALYGVFLCSGSTFGAPFVGSITSILFSGPTLRLRWHLSGPPEGPYIPEEGSVDWGRKKKQTREKIKLGEHPENTVIDRSQVYSSKFLYSLIERGKTNYFPDIKNKQA